MQAAAPLGILNIYREMGYDAVHVGARDIAAGIASLRSVESPPLLSANIFERSSGKAAFIPYLVKELGTLRIGITGLTGKPETLEAGYRREDWRSVLPGILEILRERSDFIIVLSSLEAEANFAIADNYPEVRLLLTSAAAGGSTGGGLRHNTLIDHTPDRGRYLGRLLIREPHAPFWQTSEEGQIVKLEAHVARLEAQAAEARSAGSKSFAPADREAYLQRLDQRLASARNRLAALQANLPKERNQLATSTFERKNIPLTSSIEEDPRIQAMVEEVQKQKKR